MANRDLPLGLQPIRHEYGTIPKIGTYTVAGGVTLYKGSPCCINASGLLAAYTNTRALAGGVIGVAAGYATEGTECAVFDDPNQLFEIQADDNTITVLAGYGGSLFRFLNPTAGNGTTLNSTCELDASTAAAQTGTTAAAVTPIRVEYKVPRVDNQIGDPLGTGTAVSWTRFAVRFIPPVHHRGMGSVGATAGAVYRAI